MCVLGHDVKFISYCKPQPKSLKATSLKYLSGQMIQTALHFGKSIWLPRRKNWRGTDVRTGRTIATVRLQMTVFNRGQGSWGWTEVLQMLRRTRVRWGRCQKCSLGCPSFYLRQQVGQLDESCCPPLGQGTSEPKRFWRHKKIIRSGHAEAQGWKYEGASWVVQWLRIRLSMQGTRVWALVREDPTCHGATKPVHHNYWARVPQLLKPAHLEPVLRNKRSHHNEKPAHRNEE